jgi:SH2 domain-containing protein 3C
VIQPDTVYEHFQYQFENEPYDTVSDLVTSYVGSGKPISMASGARIATPANRTTPLLCCTPGRSTITKGPLWKSAHCSSNRGSSDSLSAFSKSSASEDSLRKTTSLCCPRNDQSCGMNCSCSSNHSANHTANDTISLSNQWKTKSLSFNEPNALCNAYNSFALQESDTKKQRTKSLSSGEVPKDGTSKDTYEDPQENAPAKPARTQAPIYQASGSDSGNGSGDSAQSSAPNDVPLGANMPRSASKLTIRRMEVTQAEESLLNVETIEFKQTSNIAVNSFRSELFSSFDNKPLESDTLQTIKLLLRTSGPMILAMHLTRVDLKYIMSPNAGKNSNPLEKIIGLELCLLAHGEQMRMDIIER